MPQPNSAGVQLHLLQARVRERLSKLVYGQSKQVLRVAESRRNQVSWWSARVEHVDELACPQVATQLSACHTLGWSVGVSFCSLAYSHDN